MWRQQRMKRWVVTVLLAVGICCWAVVLANAAPTSRPEAGAQRTDAYGDSLPSGALFRLGTIRLRHGGDGTVRCLAFSSDGGKLASGGDDRAVRIWDAANGKPLHRFTGGGAFIAVAFSPDGA